MTDDTKKTDDTESAALTQADATADETTGATADTTTPPQPPRRIAGVLALIAVLFLALALGGMGWWGYQQLEQLRAAQTGLVERSALTALERDQQDRLGEMAGRVSNLNERVETRLESLAQMQNRVEDGAAARRNLTDRVDQLYRRMQAERADWHGAEAAYLARIAQHRLRVNADVAGAAEALEAAARL